MAVKPLQSPARPPKRRYAEIADSEDEGADSDELYGWAEDDEVEAEGLLINRPSLPDDLSTTDTQTNGDALPAPDAGGVTRLEAQARDTTIQNRPVSTFAPEHRMDAGQVH